TTRPSRSPSRSSERRIRTGSRSGSSAYSRERCWHTSGSSDRPAASPAPLSALSPLPPSGRRRGYRERRRSADATPKTRERALRQLTDQREPVVVEQSGDEAAVAERGLLQRALSSRQVVAPHCGKPADRRCEAEQQCSAVVGAKLRGRVVPHAVRGEQGDIAFEDPLLDGASVLDAERVGEEEGDVCGRGTHGHGLPVENDDRALIVWRIEDQVVEVEVGMNQALRPAVQRLGNGREARAKASDDLSYSRRQARSVLGEEPLDLTVVVLLPRARRLREGRKGPARCGIAPPACMERRQLLDEVRRVVDRAAAQYVALPPAAHVLQQEHDAAVRVVCISVIHPERHTPPCVAR